MFRKMYKQFLAAVLSASMLIGQVQLVNAASNENEDFVLTEDDSEILFSEDELTEDEDSDALTEELLTEEDAADAASSEASEEAGSEASEETSEEAGSEASEEASAENTTEESLEEASSEASEDAADAASSEASEEQANAPELPRGIEGMAEDYQLSDSEALIKAAAVSKKDEYFKDFADLTEGVDYAKDQVVFLSETKEHAEEVALAYAGTVKSYENGVAVIDLSESEITVADAYSCAFVEGINLPVVTPDYYFHVDAPIEADNEYLGLYQNKDQQDAEETAAGTATEEAVAAEDASEEVSSDEEDDASSEEATEVTVEATEEASEDASEDENEFSEVERKLMAEPYLDSTASEYQWYHDMIGSYTAWEFMGVDGLDKTGNVTVAVIDTGVAAHPELNLVNDGEFDDNHGTLVAGVIGAKFNGNGGAGVAPGVGILNLKTDLTSGSVMAQLRAAVDAKADVVNMSFVGNNTDPQFAAVVEEVYAAGITMVAAMGDSKSETAVYPAAYDKVIAVASVNEAGKLSAYSAAGAYCDVAAPGSNIWTTDTDADYKMMSGTSMASPVVAGACALYMSEYGHVSPETMKDLLMASAEVSGEDGIGTGIVNVNKLLGVQAGASNAKIGKIKFALSKKGLTYNFLTNAADTATITATAFTANGKNDVTSQVTSYVWTSSNANVVEIRSGANGRTVTIASKSVGSAKITVKAKTAGMKTYKVASYTVKVTGQKTVKSVGLNATKVTLYADTGVKNAPHTFKATATFYSDAKKKTAIPVKGAPVWKSSNSKVATVDANGNITALKKGTAKITCAARDGSGKKATITVVVKKLVSSLEVKGRRYVTIGGGFKFSTKANKDANSKAVTWSIQCISGGLAEATISKTGKVTVKKAATEHSKYRVTATANDLGHKQASYEFEVLKKTTKITPSKKTVQVGTQKVGNLETYTTVSVTTSNNGIVDWKASNKNIKITKNGNSCRIDAVKKGKTTLTAVAQDGSGKKATITVKVNVPVTSVKVLPSNKERLADYVATGASISFKSQVASTFGKPSVTKVSWSYDVYVNGGTKLTTPKDAVTRSGGKLSVKKNALDKYKAVQVVLTATATDGTGIKASKTVTVVPRLKNFGFPQSTSRFMTLYYKMYAGNSEEVTGFEYLTQKKTVSSPVPFKAVSNNNSIVKASCRWSNEFGCYVLYLEAKKVGKAKVTVRTLDGSGLSSTGNVWVY